MIDELERLLAAATPGPWKVANWVGRRVIEPTRARYPHTQYVFEVGGVIDQVGGDSEANAALACALRNAAPALLRVVTLARRARRLAARADHLAEAMDADPDNVDTATAWELVSNDEADTLEELDAALAALEEARDAER